MRVRDVHHCRSCGARWRRLLCRETVRRLVFLIEVVVLLVPVVVLLFGVLTAGIRCMPLIRLRVAAVVSSLPGGVLGHLRLP
jgi:hypothetical protein